MRFVATALLLGCAAAGTEVAVHSKSFNVNESNLQPTSEVRTATSFFWQPFSNILNHTGSAGRSVDSTPSSAIQTAIPKEEALRLIGLAAAKHNVPCAFVKSIVAVESNFDATAVSPKGAIGLMQLMPETAHQYGADDPAVPEQNIDAGTHYLRALMDRYSNTRSSLQRVIAAYNAGPGMVDKYRGIPPFRETKRYVVKVLGFLRRFQLDDKRAVRS